MKLKASFTAPLFILIINLLVVASKLLEGRFMASGGNLYLTVIILQVLIFIIPSIIFCRLKGIGYSMKLNVRFFAPNKIGSILLTTLVIASGTVMIRFAQVYLLHYESFGFSLFDSYLNAIEKPDFLFESMAFAVMPALAEEFVFRTVLLTEYNESGHGAVTATIISAVLYGMIYLSIEKLPLYLFAGIFYAMLTYCTGSSLTTLLCHVLFNFYGLYIEKYIIRAVVNPSNVVITFFSFGLLFLLMLIIMFGEYEHILHRTAVLGTPTPSYRLRKTADGNTPDIAATEADEEGIRQGSMRETTRLAIDAFFSPSFLLCILIFVISVLSLLPNFN